MKRIIKRAIKEMYTLKLKKDEKKLLKNVNTKLTKEERKIISKRNYNMAKIVKQTYMDWDKSDKKYFLSDVYYQIAILPVLNSINYNELGIRNKYSYFSDKNYQEKFVKLFSFPNTIIRRINGDFYDKDFNYISFDDVLNVLKKYKSSVFKVSMGSGHGRGVELVESKDYEKILHSFGKNYVVQEKIEQHEQLAYYNHTSVNVIRITSLLWKGHVYILGAVLRVGAPGAFCDHLGYGENKPRIIALDKDGKLVGKAVAPDICSVYDDIFGKKISGTIPCFNKMVDFVKKEHIKFAHHRIIGWDLTVDKNENAICIEFNSNVPGIAQSQMVCGPIFGKKSINDRPLLDEIISNIE